MMMQFIIVSYFACFVKALRLDFFFIYQISKKSRFPAPEIPESGIF